MESNIASCIIKAILELAKIEVMKDTNNRDRAMGQYQVTFNTEKMNESLNKINTLAMEVCTTSENTSK